MRELDKKSSVQFSDTAVETRYRMPQKVVPYRTETFLEAGGDNRPDASNDSIRSSSFGYTRVLVIWLPRRVCAGLCHRQQVLRGRCEA